MFQHYLPPEIAPRIPYDILGSSTEGYSGSDIRLVCKESAMAPLRRLGLFFFSLPPLLSPLNPLYLAVSSNNSLLYQWTVWKKVKLSTTKVSHFSSPFSLLLFPLSLLLSPLFSKLDYFRAENGSSDHGRCKRGFAIYKILSPQRLGEIP